MTRQKITPPPRFAVIAPLGLLLCAAITACSAPASPPSTKAPLHATTATPAIPIEARPAITVATAINQAATLAGTTVIVRGAYIGWSGRCTGGPPVTRSDWMLEDADRCLYVSGPLPPGIAAPAEDTTALGRPLRVEGTMAITPDGRPYLRASTPE